MFISSCRRAVSVKPYSRLGVSHLASRILATFDTSQNCDAEVAMPGCRLCAAHYRSADADQRLRHRYEICKALCSVACVCANVEIFSYPHSHRINLTSSEMFTTQLPCFFIPDHLTWHAVHGYLTHTSHALCPTADLKRDRVISIYNNCNYTIHVAAVAHPQPVSVTGGYELPAHAKKPLVFTTAHNSYSGQ